VDEESVRGAQRGAVGFQPLFGAGRRRGCWRARAPLAPLGLLGQETLALTEHGTQDRLHHLGHDVQRADGLRPLPAYLPEGSG
jgi:hypothetical protein